MLECDPQRKQEYTEVFQKVIRVKMELDPFSADRHMETQEFLTLKVLVRGEEAQPLAVRIMLTSENDVQLYYCVTYDDMSFGRLAVENHLQIRFNQLIPTLNTLITDCIRRPKEYSCCFTLDDREGVAKLKF